MAPQQNKNEHRYWLSCTGCICCGSSAITTASCRPSNRSMKLLVIAGVTYAISWQFQKAATLLLTTSYSSPSLQQAEVLPLEARRLGYVPRIVMLTYYSSPNSNSGHQLLQSVKAMVTNPSLSSTKLVEECMPSDGPHIQPHWYQPNAYDWVDGYDMNVCIPMTDWQAKSYPTCNTFHEIDMSKLRVINSGGSRTAFEMKVQDGRIEKKYVYKTMKYTKEIEMKRIEEQRKDSMVMERTSASNFIPDVYGYCSVGVLMDFMPEGKWEAEWRGGLISRMYLCNPVLVQCELGVSYFCGFTFVIRCI